ncbi:MAG: TolC family outer membrane protein [Aquabacterium sp.]|nr:TolC family outer membrane protein [Aquabacterium sp.]
MSKSAPSPTSPNGPIASARWRPLVQVAAMACLSTVACGFAQAENLVDLYQAAKGYDAAYLSAKAQAESVQYQTEQAHALFRPSLGLGGALTRSRFEAATQPTANQLAQAQLYNLPPGGNSTSTSRTIGLTAKQTLFNQADSAKVDQAEQALIAAQADLTIAENELATKLTQAYFDVLSAEDVLNTTQANKKGLSEQLASAKRNFEVGNATITDTREAQARFDLAAAQEIAATNDLQVKHIALDQLVGRADVKPSPLLTPVKLDALAPGKMSDWVAQADQSPSVRKANVGLVVAKLEVDKAKAGHMPVLDAVAKLSRTGIDSASASLKSSAGNTASIGLELNMPLYAGGSVQNRVKEVLALQEKAERDVDLAKRTVSLITRQAFSGVQSGLAQVKAYEAAETSAKLALEATQLGYRVGVRINKDVLDAQTQVTSTQKDLYKARYDVIVGSVKLKQAIGVLKPEDLIELNKLVAQ